MLVLAVALAGGIALENRVRQKRGLPDWNKKLAKEEEEWKKDIAQGEGVTAALGRGGWQAG